MRKLASILVLVLAVTFSAQAQNKRMKRGLKMSPEQQTTLAVKKMTLALNLDDKQQRAITSLISQKIENRKSDMEARKAMRKANKKPTTDQIFAMKNKQLDAQIAMKNKMKEILDKEQFEKFEKMAKAKMRKAGKKMKQRGKKRERK